ncbi:Polyketide synthase [Madurella fahalii]|uniref:Polyketide synthase n=1 Tax=Madurella fahalii TaxID=1157608 RepID=A0ABQ0G4P8_9PEZI
MALDQRDQNAGARHQLSGAFFCPQSRAPDADYLAGLHAFLNRDRHGQALLREVANLGTDGTWEIFATANGGVSSLAKGPKYLGILRNWAVEGVSEPLAAVHSGIVALPLLAIVQIGQYLRYLEFRRLSHRDLLAEVGDGGGLQGYCGGLPAAIAIACATDETAVVRNAGAILRILVGVGAYAEAADDTREEDGSTTLALRLKHEGQGDELTSRFPGTHVSAITDPRSISIAGPAAKLDQLYHFARGQGLQVQKMQVRGSVHNPGNAQLAADLVRTCRGTPSLQLPESSRLQAPVRSNRTASKLRNGSLIEEIVTTILASRCEWFNLLGEVARDLKLSARASHSFVIFGLTDCVPLSPFHKQSLRVTKTEAHSLIKRIHVNKRDCGTGLPPTFADDAIAVIGASCRLPGANDLEELWDLLARGVDCHRDVPTDRFNLPGSSRASQSGSFARDRQFYGNFLDDVKRFDNAFFKISPREAANMDPQQRLLLELSYEALEAAGYLKTHSREQGDNVGCFIGASFVEYLDNTNAHPPTAYTSTGTIRAFLCGRISYYYGWSGPAEVVDTACSSSLVAIHRACKAIQGQECRMALAGGINIITGINNYMDLAKAGFLSPTGQCKPFDASADGYCRSDGAGLVVLKKLKQALADGDHIWGVIPAAATNQGGLSSSITVPQPTAQQALYRTVLERAGLGPEHVTYVEAHGTGTQAGDPLEIESVRAVLAKDSTGAARQQTLHIGSVKGNIGHCETAAGVAGLLKVLAMLKHGRIPAQVNHSRLNPKIPPLEADRLAIVGSMRDWDVPFRAALVSSYGAAGSNCVLLCCEIPIERKPQVENRPATTLNDFGAAFPLLLTAATEQSLRQNARELGRYLRSSSAAHLHLPNVAFTLNERRQRLKYFASITAQTVHDAADKLDNMASALDAPSVFEVSPKAKPVVLAFSGQTDRTIALHRSFYDRYPVFRYYMDSCDNELRKLCYGPLIPAIFQPEPIGDIATLQCGIFAVQYASARCWMDAGLQPRALVGHSLGELTALCLSGVLSLPDAIRLVAARGRLVQTKWGDEKGAMLALNCSVDEFHVISRLVLERGQPGTVGGGLEIACFNGTTSLVAVGTSATIAAAEDVLRNEPSLSGIRFQRLSTSHGFHSVLVDPILVDLAAVSRSLTWNEPKIPLYTCTAEPLGSVKGEYDVVRHAREPVFFTQAVRRIENSLGPCVWIEAGMDSPITNMARRAAGKPDIHTFQAMKTRQQVATVAPADAVSAVVSSLWRSGLFPTHWSFLTPTDSPGTDRCKQVWLPPYQFQRTPHWLPNIDRVIEAQQTLSTNTSNNTSQQEKPPPPPPLVTRKKTSNERLDVAEFVINTESQRFQKLVGGHAVRSRPLCPASVYAECATMATQQLLPDAAAQDRASLTLEQVRFLAPLGASDHHGEVILRLEQQQQQQQQAQHEQSWTFSISTVTHQQANSKPPHPQPPNPTLHATGTISLFPTAAVPPATETYLTTLQRLVAGSAERVRSAPDADTLTSHRAYALFSRVVDYAPFFRAISRVALRGREAAATVSLPDGPDGPNSQQQQQQPGRENSTAWRVCDAVLLDACVQVAGLLVNSSGEMVGEGEVAVMVGLDRAVVAPGACDPDRRARKVYVKIEEGGRGVGEKEFVGDVFVFSEEGKLTATLCGCRFMKMMVSKLEMMLDRLARPARLQVALNARTLSATTSPGLSRTSSRTGSSMTTMDVLAFNPTPPSSTPSITHDSDDAEDGYSALREMIAGYTGLDGSEVPDETVLSDLGLDSLASVELTEQLSSTFGISIDTADLVASTVSGLARRIGLFPSGGPLPDIMPGEESFGPPSMNLDPRKPSSSPVGYKRLLGILSSLSGVKKEDIASQHALADLGIDSLALVELQEELRSSFSVSVADLDVCCTLQELMARLDIDGPHTAQRNAEQGESKPPKSIDATAAEEDNAEQAASVILRNPFDALESSDAHFETSAAKRGFSGYWTSVASLQDEVTVAYIVEAFSALGVDLRRTPCGHRVPPVPHLAHKYDRLMSRLWEILRRHDIVSGDPVSDGMTRGAGRIGDRSAAELHAALQARYPSFRDETDLMGLAGPRLAECLAGKMDPVQVMFGSAASMKIMENYYSQSPMLSAMTEQLAIFLTTLLKDTGARGRPIRILEVGAGTGGTTKRLAEALESAGISSIQYTFTDISPGFVSKAKVKLKRYPWIHYTTLDLEKEIPAELRNRFDVVIGTNCVHATTDRIASCRRLRDAVIAGGVVVLSEVTRVIDWYDIAFGLLDGWWVADGRTAYPLQPAEWWMLTLRASGFACASYSRGPTPEANTQQLLVACTKEWQSNPKRANGIPGFPAEQGIADGYRLETIVYKEVGGVKIHADVYFPRRPTQTPMPVALMIHGGGYMTLSRKAIRPAQTRHLLANGFLPVGIDYRLCPEVTLTDGPIADVCSAYAWTKTSLAQIAASLGFTVDAAKVVAIGWSSGGHLAVSLGWTAREAGLEPPAAVLSFYAPYDFESGELDSPRLAWLPSRKMSLERIKAALPSTPVTEHCHSRSAQGDTANLGWLRPGDPRSELVLSLFKEGIGLSLLLNGLSRSSATDSLLTRPAPELVASISPLSRLRAGEYTVPTYVIHGTADEVAPFEAAESFVREMRARGVPCGFLAVPRGRHVHDVGVERGTREWEEGVEGAYRFLFEVVRIKRESY